MRDSCKASSRIATNFLEIYAVLDISMEIAVGDLADLMADIWASWKAILPQGFYVSLPTRW
jgi:hypothetical protein